MKNILKSLLVAFVAMFGFGMSLACSSCASTMGSDKVIERNLNVARFSKVEMYTSADVKFVQGTRTSVRVVGNADLVDNLTIEQSRGCLALKSKGGRTLTWGNRRKSQLTVYVSSPRLDGVKIIGSGDFDANGYIDTDNLDVQVNGSGDVKIGRVTCKNLKCKLQGSGDMSVGSAICTSADFTLNGSGDMDVKRLKAVNANLQVNGSGDLDARLDGVSKTMLGVAGSGDLDVEFVGCNEATCTVRGSGDIELKGTLRSLSKSKKGTGDIDTSGLRLRR